MLKYKSIVSVLEQSVQPDAREHATAQQLKEYLHHSAEVIISSILITASGRPVSSYHNTRVPPVPRHDASKTIAPYYVDRTMKTKVYGLFASAIWEEYSQEEGNEGEQATETSSPRPDWVSVRTEDALFVIRSVTIDHGSHHLLLILVADPATPLGFVARKSRETTKVLREGLQEYSVVD